MPPLTPSQRRLRFAIIACATLAVALPVCKNLNPSFPSLPCVFKALTGLPCIFCGGTRSACAALSGNFEYSLYLNALALPSLVVITLGAGICLLEILKGRPMIHWDRILDVLIKLSPLLLIALLVWWAFHIITALRTPKTELLDPEKTIPSKLRHWLKP